MVRQVVRTVRHFFLPYVPDLMALPDVIAVVADDAGEAARLDLC